MNLFKRIICVVLSLIFVMQMLTGCSAKKGDEEIYLTKGEFFAYFVYENNMTSDKYSAEDIEKCKDGSIEADIIVEWGYLTEKQAEKNLKKPVDKETVVLVCANATFDLKEGKVADIKDADLLDNPQIIADAYASGFFELENGYFDGAQKMSFADCEKIMKNARDYTGNFHYESNTEITETATDVKEQDSSNYSDGDIIIEFYENESEPETGSDISASGMSYSSSGLIEPKITFLNTNSSPKIQTLENKNQNNDIIALNGFGNNGFGLNRVKGFSATILKHVFEQNLGNPNVGDTVVVNRWQILMNNSMVLGNGSGEVIGILKDKKLLNGNYVCIFEYPNFEEAVKKKNVKKANGSGIDEKSFVKEKTEVDGWKLEFNLSGGGVSVTAKKDFTVHETGRKQEWQNSKKTMTAEANFSINDFNLDVNNLGSFASKKDKGYVKITCDTEMGFSLSQSLRYTPDSNRNGKFPSNWSNSRWTDSDSKGAKTIKIARFSPSLYGVVNIDVYIYLLISVDGKISFKTSIDDGGVQIQTNNGKISLIKLGKKTTEVSANVNLHGRLGVDASLKIFCFINVIEYDVGADLDLHATANLYYEEKLSRYACYADEEGLNEYAADDSKFNYCIDVLIELGVSGKLMDSGVKLILDALDAGSSLNFTLKVWKGGFHFEDGSFVDKCSRGEEETDEEIPTSKNDEIELETYKVTLIEGTCQSVSLTAIPAETKDFLNSTMFTFGAKSSNESVCTVKFNSKTNSLIIEAVGEGSAEITVMARIGGLWWKMPCEQEISVTVNKNPDFEVTDMNYVIVPDSKFNVYCA